MKNIDEIRQNMRRIGIARFYYNGTIQMLLRMFDDGTLPKVEPKIERGKMASTSERKQRDFWNYHLFRQMLTDRILLESYLLEEEIIPKYGVKTEKNKEYITVKFYPKSRTKTVMIFQDGGNE